MFPHCNWWCEFTRRQHRYYNKNTQTLIDASNEVGLEVNVEN
jgi:hypothetical protein